MWVFSNADSITRNGLLQASSALVFSFLVAAALIFSIQRMFPLPCLCDYPNFETYAPAEVDYLDHYDLSIRISVVLMMGLALMMHLKTGSRNWPKVVALVSVFLLLGSFVAPFWLFEFGYSVPTLQTVVTLWGLVLVMFYLLFRVAERTA